MSASPPPIILPTTTIQHDFGNVLSDIYTGAVPSEDIWLSFYKQGEHSVHGKLSASLHEEDRERVVLVGSEGVGFERIAQYRYTASCSALGVASTSVIAPSQVLADPVHSIEQHPHQITALGLSQTPPFFATGFADGTLSLYDLPSPPRSRTPYPPTPIQTANPIASSKVHKSTLTALHILHNSAHEPILVSAGADFAIHLTPIPSSRPSSAFPLTLAPTASLTSHTRAITALQPLAFAPSALLSASKDGSLRLWDMYAGAMAGAWGTTGWTAANALAEDGRVVWAALADGHAEAFDVRARTSVARLSAGDAALTAIDVSSGGGEVVVGGTDGVVSLFDVRALGSGSEAGPAKTRWQRSGAEVEGIVFLGGHRIVVGGEDGLPYIINIGTEGLIVEAELVFGDVEGVRALRVRDSEVWLAGDGGMVRRYDI